MPHTLEWFDHADPPRRGDFEHPGDDPVDPHILAKFAETVLRQAGVSYEPPIRVIYTYIDSPGVRLSNSESKFWSVLPLAPGKTDNSDV